MSTIKPQLEPSNSNPEPPKSYLDQLKSNQEPPKSNPDQLKSNLESNNSMKKKIQMLVHLYKWHLDLKANFKLIFRV